MPAKLRDDMPRADRFSRRCLRAIGSWCWLPVDRYLDSGNSHAGIQRVLAMLSGRIPARSILQAGTARVAYRDWGSLPSSADGRNRWLRVARARWRARPGCLFVCGATLTDASRGYRQEALPTRYLVGAGLSWHKP